LTARCRLRVEQRPRFIESCLGKRGSFFGWLAPCWSNLLTSHSHESRGTAETALLPFAEPIVAGARQCVRRLVSSRCLPSKKSEGQTLFRGVCAGALPLLACGGSRRTSSSKLITLRLDSWRAVVNGRFRAKCALTTSADGYFNEHSHGPLELPNPGGVFGMTAWLVHSCLFSNGSRRSYAGPGAENTDPRHSPPQLLGVATSPQPRSLQTLRVANIELFPALENTGKSSTPPRAV
jgi:hypothetical protein